MIGRFLSGAKNRLLPPSVPFRFFAAATLFYVLFWAVLFWKAGEVAGYRLGSGPVLALIHLATLGVLTMTVIGASLQLLSVATRKAFRGVWICRLLSWVYIPGFIVLAYGMFANWYPAMLIGAGFAGLGLLIFFFLIIDNIRGVRGMAAIMAHCWASMLFLFAAVAIGILLVVNLDYGLDLDQISLASSHFILAIFGFMSLIAMGFSYILVPMFAIAPAPSEKNGRLSIACNVVAIIIALAGINSHQDWLLMVADILGMVGVGFYLYGMITVYKTRMRKRLGTPFVLIRVSWVMLPLALIWGAVGIGGYWPQNGYALFALLAIIGWLLTFLNGVLQRIIPFLGSMHGSNRGGPLLASSMADMRLFDLNAVGHLAGLTFVALGIIIDNDSIIRLGAGLGFIGGLGLFSYVVIVVGLLSRKQRETASDPL